MNSKDRTYICPACVVNEKTNGLICSDCQDEHKRISMSAIRTHRPVETELQYALKKTEENLTSLSKELEDLKKLAERIEWLKQTIYFLENQKRWLEKINYREAKRKVAEYEKTAV